MKRRLAQYTAICVSSLCLAWSPALAQCTLTLQTAISSGWHKDNVTYTVEKNRLSIKVAEKVKDDADSIYIGSITDCRTLTVDVLKLSGNYPWGGKIIGFSFFNDKREANQWGNQASFPSPRGRAIDDGFVKDLSAGNGKLVYDLANTAATVHLGAKVFIGAGNSLELVFGTEAAPAQIQLSNRPAFRPSPRYKVKPGLHPGDAAASCSTQCHEPRTRDDEVDFIAEFSLPPGAACPHRRD